MAMMRQRVLAGRYVLGEVLGTGGMATVWRAFDQVLGREVAVKILSPQYAADAGFVARFEREARHAARLSHPGLVTVFDSGVDNDAAFIVMELVAWPTLRRVLDEQGVLAPDEAIRIAAAVCEPLGVAHAAGLVHRDIKPANILISGRSVKVLDFGIARAEGGASVTGTLGVLGTAAYLSPEQASGGHADPQSDLYSLGCVLFEMLTGTAPFSSDSAVGLAYRHVHDDPGLPSAWSPWVPAELDWITTQLLAKDPAARPPSAAAARSRLLAALRSDATAVLPGGSGDHFRQASHDRQRRSPTRAELVLAAAVAAALAALAAVLITGGHGQRALPPAAPVSHPPTTSASPAPEHTTSSLPPMAEAAATIVGDLEAGVTDGQVTPQAGQDLYNNLQQILFTQADQDSSHLQHQYDQLLQTYQQDLSQGQITGQVATLLGPAISGLGTVLGPGIDTSTGQNGN